MLALFKSVFVRSVPFRLVMGRHSPPPHPKSTALRIFKVPYLFAKFTHLDKLNGLMKFVVVTITSDIRKCTQEGRTGVKFDELRARRMLRSDWSISILLQATRMLHCHWSISIRLG